MYKIFLTFFLLYLSSCFLSTNLFIYYESNVLFLSSFLGAIKFRCTKGFFAQTKLYFIKYHLAFIKSSFLFFSNYYGAFKKKYSLLKKLNFIFNMLSYGFMIRFKVIGLGHRGYYTKGVYLFKLGYSHLVLYTLSFTILSSIKPKKHPFHRI